jgi:hypothetical protein
VDLVGSASIHGAVAGRAEAGSKSAGSAVEIEDQEGLWVVAQQLETESGSDIVHDPRRFSDQGLLMPPIQLQREDVPSVNCLSIGCR